MSAKLQAESIEIRLKLALSGKSLDDKKLRASINRIIFCGGAKRSPHGLVRNEKWRSPGLNGVQIPARFFSNLTRDPSEATWLLHVHVPKMFRTIHFSITALISREPNLSMRE